MPVCIMQAGFYCLLQLINYLQYDKLKSMIKYHKGGKMNTEKTRQPKGTNERQGKNMKNGLKELIDEILSGIAFVALFFLILFGGAYILPILDMLIMHNM